MPRRCTVCLHPKRTEVDKALVANRTFRSIADDTGLSEAALKRHAKSHLPTWLAKANAPVDPVANEQRLVEYHQEREAQDTREAIDAMAQLKAINAACLEVLRKAREAEDHSILLRAVDRIAKQIELQARLLGEIQDGQTVNVAVLPEWHGIRQRILDALRSFPEARFAVAHALNGGAV